MKLGNWLRGGAGDRGEEGRPESPNGAREQRARDEDERPGAARGKRPRVRARDRSGERTLRAAVARAERDAGGKKGRRRREAGRRGADRAWLRSIRKRAGSGATRLRRSARPALAVLLTIGSTAAVIYLTLLGALLQIGFVLVARIGRPVRSALRRLGLLLRRSSALLTPERALIAVVAGAAVLLGLSQFADYRSLSIGTAAYDSVQTIAPPPETGRMPTGSAHAYAFVPLAALGLAALLVAVRTRRPQLCRVLAAIGAAAILVALLVDRPRGLDPGATALSFDGVQAHLLGGFYAQVAAGLLLACSSLLLARELRGGGTRKRRSGTRRAPRLASIEGAGA